LGHQNKNGAQKRSVFIFW